MINSGKRLSYPPDGNLKCKLHLSAGAILYTALHPTPTVSKSLESPTNQEKLMINHHKITFDRCGRSILKIIFESEILANSGASIFKTYHTVPKKIKKKKTSTIEK